MHRILPLLLLAACANPPALDGPFTPDASTGGCGLPDYTWAPMPGMGEVIDWQYADSLSYDKATLQTVLRQGGITAFQPKYGVRVYYVRYRTQDHGQPVEATGFVSFPDVDTQQVFPTVLWLHGTSGFNDDCAPTAQGLAGAAGNLILSSQGLVVAAPDYLGMAGWGEPSGMLHPWVVPEPTAIASLDSLRALWQFSDQRLDPPNHAVAEHRYVIWGASEGGAATLWADRYAMHYLPGAEEVAAVAAVPPTDLLGIAKHATSHFESATAAAAALLVSQHDWYQGTAPLTDVLQPDIASALPDAMRNSCGDGGVFDGLTSADQIFTSDVLSAAQSGQVDTLQPWGCYLQQGTLHDTTIPRGQDAPVLFIVSQNDDLVVADVERADVPVLCDQGYTLDYLECAGVQHAEGAALSLPYQLTWLQDRLAGVPLPSDTCTVRAPVDCSQFGLTGHGSGMRSKTR